MTRPISPASTDRRPRVSPTPALNSPQAVRPAKSLGLCRTVPSRNSLTHSMGLPLANSAIRLGMKPIHRSVAVGSGRKPPQRTKVTLRVPPCRNQRPTAIRSRASQRSGCLMPAAPFWKCIAMTSSGDACQPSAVGFVLFGLTADRSILARLPLPRQGIEPETTKEKAGPEALPLDGLAPRSECGRKLHAGGEGRFFVNGCSRGPEECLVDGSHARPRDEHAEEGLDPEVVDVVPDVAVDLEAHIAFVQVGQRILDRSLVGDDGRIGAGVTRDATEGPKGGTVLGRLGYVRLGLVPP